MVVSQFHPYIVTGIFAGSLTILIVGLLSKISGSLGLVDVPDSRKRHGESVPVVGGIAIYLVILGLAVANGLAENGLFLILGCSIIVLAGAIDDVFELSVGARLICQGISASVVLVGSDLWIADLASDPYFLSDFPYEIGFFLTILWVVGVTNAFNMADGIDGLSIGYFLVALGGVFLVHIEEANNIVFSGYLLVVFFVASAVGLVNLRLTPLRRVFLGDAGSMLLGFSAAWIFVFSSQKDPDFTGLLVMIWFVSIPIADTVIVMVRRFLIGRSIFSPDREHIHYILTEANLSERQALLVLMLMGVSAGAIGLCLSHFFGQLASLIGFMIWIVLIWGATSILKRKPR